MRREQLTITDFEGQQFTTVLATDRLNKAGDRKRLVHVLDCRQGSMGSYYDVVLMRDAILHHTYGTFAAALEAYNDLDK